MSVVHEPGKPLDYVERVFDHDEWDTHHQQRLAEMADALEKRVGEHRVQNATVHVYERKLGSVVVKMVAGPR